MRATADLDLFVAADDANLDNLRTALQRLGYDLSEAETKDFQRYKILLRQHELPLESLKQRRG